MPQWKVACFDLDGTLVKNTSTGQHLAGKMGHADEMAKIERWYKEGKVSNADVAALDGKYYRGYSVSDIHGFLDDIPTVDHISETVSYFASRGIPSIVCILAWKFVAEYFANKYGFSGWSGPDLELDSSGIFTGRVLTDFHETDKPVYVNDYCQKIHANLSEAFHVGDSRSDLPLFKQVGFSVAFNADTTTQLAASVSVDSGSLLDILTVIPGIKP
ncbi:HAD family hydrolase [Vibrio salinus]|uniref:HAD family hydrolase n=1 Tax=Vibrio salinus TaxID=2899784 RepID=UPI001E286CD4|nr:HAD-IB family phosphatase [Vibrio salinus]MCE0492737.1 HAD-IB family phosphatase [Vibrio salinus]